MHDLKRQRAIEVAGLQLRVAVPEKTAARISSSALYRYGLRPAARQAYHAMRWVAGARPRHSAAAVSYIPAAPPTPEDVSREVVALIQEVAPFDWDHSIHVGHGVITPGRFNHYRLLQAYRLPDSLQGMRCLDAAPRDGFWTFEMVRRGAAEVVALDLEGPERERHAGNFATAARLLDAAPKRVPADLYDLDPHALGRFDLIVFSDQLNLVRDPQRVLEGLYSVCRGTLVLGTGYDALLDRYGDASLSEFVARGTSPARWWLPSTNTVRAMMSVAGFMPVQVVAHVDADAGPAVVMHGTATDHNPWSVFVSGVAAANGASSSDHDDGQAAAYGPTAEAARARTLSMGDADITIGLSGRRAARLAGSSAYRRLVRPVLDRLAPRPGGAPAREIEQTGAEAGGTGTRPNGASALAERVAAIPWYHTIDLGHGVVTSGFVDHRSQLAAYRLPESLEGKRCLDVATFDGYWAFELERRGAGHVVATDIADGMDCDLPRLMRVEAEKDPKRAPMGLGFRIAHEFLGSKVEHRICSVYHLSPERVGLFDFVFLGDLLLHLRDPQAALLAIASVCRGELHMAEVYEPSLEDFGERSLSRYSPWLPSFTWWLPSTNTLRAMLGVAGFTDVEELNRVVLKTRDGQAAKVVYRAKGRAK
jgi:tRNA (mo5U34)-methyltransferase